MKNILKKLNGFIGRNKLISFGIIVAIILGIVFISRTPSSEKNPYATVAITRGTLKQIVTATGEIMPLNTILVGSQVSGIIENIFVDYNDVVTKDQVLLKIEPSVLQATADEAKASLESAESQRNFAKSEYNRNKTLFDDGFIARSEMEQSKTSYETSEQAVKRAQSQYDRAVVNLGYATITSPVDGTVISRKVDKGQTVAASFQAPDLFEIAEDLSKMQIETAVSEADIGMIKQGQEVQFTVDAYPTKTFNGFVKQIRLSPTMTSNVVVYTVVIDVDNSDLHLMPGMTAFVTINIQERDNVWKAPNSAFLVRSFNNIIDNPPSDASPRTHLAILRDKAVVLIPYKRGLATSTETEIISDEIVKGDKIITGKLGMTGTATPVNMPRGGRR